MTPANNTAPTDSKISLRLERMPDGGYVVYDEPPATDYNRGTCVFPLFASTSVGEALDYIKKRVSVERVPT